MLVKYGTWRAPMIAFGLIGLICIGVVAAFVRPWLSEANRAAANGEDASAGGAGTLRNWNTAVLLFISVMAGLVTYGFLWACIRLSFASTSTTRPPTPAKS